MGEIKPYLMAAVSPGTTTLTIANDRGLVEGGLVVIEPGPYEELNTLARIQGHPSGIGLVAILCAPLMRHHAPGASVETTGHSPR